MSKDIIMQKLQVAINEIEVPINQVLRIKYQKINNTEEVLLNLEKEEIEVNELIALKKHYLQVKNKIDDEISLLNENSDANFKNYISQERERLKSLNQGNINTFKREFLNIGNRIEGIKNLNNSDNNIFIIGENGSGKTTFIKNLSSNTGMTYLKAVKQFSKAGNMPKIPVNSNFNFNQIFNQNTNEHTIASILSKIYNQYARNENEYWNRLEYIKNIWADIFNNKHYLDFKSNRAYLKKQDEEYLIEQGSDGEYLILIYLLIAIFSKENSYITIDEVDNHLNIRQIRKLFEHILLKRPDLKFVFTTHNYEFIQSFDDKTVFWCEDNKIEKVEKNFFVENPRYCNLLYGNSEKILVCEGENTDELFYRLIFKDYNVISAKSCKEVEETVRVLKKEEKNIIGIIDRDYLREEEINKKERKGIFVLPYRHIENLLASEFIFNKMCIKNPAYNTYTEEYEKLKTNINIDDKEIISDYHKDMIEKMENLITGCKTLSDILELNIPQVESMKQPTTYDEFLQRYKPKGQCNKIKPKYKEEVIATLELCGDFCEDIRSEFFSKIN